MYVRNIRGTADNGGNWLDAWKEFKGINVSTSIHCGVYGCTKTATDGTHVIKTPTGLRQFIVPMCHGHNLTYDVDLHINDWATPMPVVK